MSRQLTAKQERFVEEYLIDLNATQAAIRSGYSKKTARDIGYENLTKPDIRAAIVEKRKAISRRLGLTIDDVIHGLWSLYEMCCQPVIELDKQGNPIMLPAKATDAKQALELVGKHLGAFPSRFEVTGQGGGPIQVEDMSDKETCRLALYFIQRNNDKTPKREDFKND